jgi:hypothetical protein
MKIKLTYGFKTLRAEHLAVLRVDEPEQRPRFTIPYAETVVKLVVLTACYLIAQYLLATEGVWR